LNARSKALEILRNKFSELIEEVMSGKTPTLVIRKRTLTNTIYDEVNGLLKLGEGVLKRSFLNVNESKKFMQTLLMASIIYESLKNNEYPTIRDLYYRGKHTIKYRDLVTRKIKEENTWDEQKESDSVIRDLEVFIDMLREDMLILSKEKGKVVGNMRIRSGDDVIDLSKMGHGAYSIEPTPDLIEFLDYDVEYVLVIEKDAVFQQLHRIGYWKTNKALLVTSAGQPDRATRRFVKRLNEELKLPVYILTDSIPADEVVVVRDLMSGKIRIGPIEELTRNYFSDLVKERVEAPLEVLSWNSVTGKITWSPIGYVYRHKIREPILKIKTDSRGVVRVTKAHSLFVLRDKKIEAIPAKDIKPGDYILVSKYLPNLTESGKSFIFVAELLKRATQNFRKSFNAFKLLVGGREINLEEASDDELREAEYLKLPESRLIPNKIELDEDLAWVMGVCTAKSKKKNNCCLIFSFRSPKVAGRVSEILKNKFGVQIETIVNRAKDRVEISVNSEILRIILEELGLLRTTRGKRIPEVIINSPRNVVLAYLKGLICEDENINKRGDVIYSTRSPVLARQVFLLLQFLGVNPVLTQNKTNYVVRVKRGSYQTVSETKERLSSVSSTPDCELAEHAYDTLKSEAFNELIEFMDGGLATLRIDDHRLFEEGDITVARVEDIEEEIYEGYVYDFAVPGDNSFVGGFGIVYHNSDPYGFYIYSVFRVGSITLSYESERLATPKARFLGVMMSDVYGSPKLGKKPYLSESERRNYIIKAKEMDIKRAKELMNYKWFQTPRWKVEIDIFLEKLSKLEIEALTSKGLRFLADTYIPNKIEVGDWLA